MKLIALSLAAVVFHAAVAAAQPASPAADTLVSAYLDVQRALAGDDFSAARSSAQDYADQLARLSASDQRGSWNNPALHEAADSLAIATEIESARRAFSDVSTEMVALLRANGPAAHAELMTVECPMAFDGKGAAWIQTASPIANPYYGSGMLRCGAATGRYLAGLGYFTLAELARIHGDTPGYQATGVGAGDDSAAAECGMSCCETKAAKP